MHFSALYIRHILLTLFGQWSVDKQSTLDRVQPLTELNESLLKTMVLNLPFCQHVLHRPKLLQHAIFTKERKEMKHMPTSHFLPLPAAMMFVQMLFSDKGEYVQPRPDAFPV